MGTLAANIKRLRAKAKLNKAELSRRAGTSVKMIEAGRRPWPRQETLEKIARVLGVAWSDLMDKRPRKKRSA